MAALAESTTVLVTGGSGFVASYVILQLLDAGYIVRATIRNLSREADVRKSLKGADDKYADGIDKRLTFFEADLTSDAGWAEAAKGCTFVHHIASPFPVGQPKDENELIVPAREGTLRALRAARAAGVRRVILTSSFAAIGYGHSASRNKSSEEDRPFTEEDWSVLSGPGVSAYHKSKTLSEKAAWEFVKETKAQGGDLELSVVNPVGVFGPMLAGGNMASSVVLVKRFLDGSMPAFPQLTFSVVDVRDVADLHLRAMTSPAAAGQRFLAVADGYPVSTAGISMLLRKERTNYAKKVPFWPMPDWVIRVVGLFAPTARALVPMLGQAHSASNKKAKEVLGWQPRSSHTALLATADSLVAAGLV